MSKEELGGVRGNTFRESLSFPTESSDLTASFRLYGSHLAGRLFCKKKWLLFLNFLTIIATTINVVRPKSKFCSAQSCQCESEYLHRNTVGPLHYYIWGAPLFKLVNFGAQSFLI